MVNAICLFLSLLPATLPASRPADLQRELSDLRREVAELREENSYLKRKLAIAVAQIQKSEPGKVQSAQAREFKPGEYKIIHPNGLNYIKKHCDTLDDALRYARNMKWQLQVEHDADTGEPFYPGIVPVTEKAPPFEIKD
jgi:hypothetical protein